MVVSRSLRASDYCDLPNRLSISSTPQHTGTAPPGSSSTLDPVGVAKGVPLAEYHRHGTETECKAQGTPAVLWNLTPAERP